MADKMKNKYNKYCENPNGMNMVLLIAMFLDPKNKLEYIISLLTISLIRIRQLICMQN